ncbi:hypothetical protein [uncultured Draconibacterium sp.]|uniref:hypothetical protein n=1 Tax=uncultured Draconibacterium sp. TaxID=1573823 RepID=UPI002AA7395A|nr:hypothetical protein [uncultured Draconibacterium sp.]
MKDSKSTIKQPLNYLRYFFLNKGLEKEEQNFFNYWIEQKQKSPKSIDIWPDRVMVSVQGELDTIDTIPYKLYDALRGKLFNEVTIAKENIDKAVAEITFNNNSPDLFLNVQANL